MPRCLSMTSDHIGEKWYRQLSDEALGYIGFGNYIYLESKEGYVEVYNVFRDGLPGARSIVVKFQYRTKNKISIEDYCDSHTPDDAFRERNYQ